MASAERTPLTPQQRLALSRRALVRQLNGGGNDAHDAFLNHAPSSAPDDDLEYEHHDAAQAGRADRPPSFGGVWLPLGRSILQRWWRRHPAHAAGQLARPVLEHYARKQPAKLMAIAAATGAALVLVRPWRLLSVTAVLAAVLKTSDVADVVNTLMQKNTSPPRKDPP
ncbi:MULTISPECIES: hypothetical protein [unclassified Variovorax]|uniref:hypothetical protein n=1 Tax=unclassified Variovorax TaxID=663243 RepID=UPI000D11B862|nr:MULTISPECIES: hypothetical protein [unclassified Variovorax]AVQ84806.1 hypothetical protein C4F17_25045 [Variovorax sp. PMC12]QRY31684.1 hypothetical protein JVX96_27155 [Variovorax sp. PDNC026]